MTVRLNAFSLEDAERLADAINVFSTNNAKVIIDSS